MEEYVPSRRRVNCYDTIEMYNGKFDFTQLVENTFLCPVPMWKYCIIFVLVC